MEFEMVNLHRGEIEAVLDDFKRCNADALKT